MYEPSSPILWQDHASGMEHGHVQTPRSSPKAVWGLIDRNCPVWLAWQALLFMRLVAAIASADQGIVRLSRGGLQGGDLRLL